MNIIKNASCWPVLTLALSNLALGSLAHADTVADPTRPPDAWLALQPQVVEPAAVNDLNDNAGARVTVIGKRQRYAVVDGQVVKAGDMVNGAKVTSIRADAVMVQQNGARKVLSLTPGVEKKTSKPARRAAPAPAK